MDRRPPERSEGTDARALAGLFRAPPEEFTAARNRLVAELRAAGRASTAAAIATLPRPTPVVWAINQAAHRDRPAVDRLLSAADQLRRAQLGHTSVDVPTAAKVYQEAVAALVELGLARLKDAGRAVSAATRHRLTGTLMAAATDPALREPLREGQLQREQTVSGFDVFGDARPPLRLVRSSPGTRPGAGEPAPAPKPSPAPASATDRAEARRQTEARVRLETARADLARAEARAEELERAEAELAQGAAEARRRAVAARRAAVQGRAEVGRARAKLRAAERADRDG